MSFTTDIPVTGDTLGGTRDRIRTNFQLIQQSFSVNHEPISSLNQGKHKFLQMPRQASAPTTAADEIGFYCKNGANPAEPNIFLRAESDGFEYQISTVISASTAFFGNNTVNYVANNNGGWTFLPGGLLMQYGRRTSPGLSGTINFPVTFPSGNNPYSIVITGELAGARSFSIEAGQITSSTFKYFSEVSGATAINWIAIGK